MKIIILHDGKYPGISAGAKRIALYEKAIKKFTSKIYVESLTPYRNDLFLKPLIPFVILLELIKRNLKADIILIYGYGWVSKLIIVLYCKILNIKTILEINEKPYSIRESGRRDILLKYFAPVNLFFLTHIVFPIVDGFIVISEELKIFVNQFASANGKILKIPILVDFKFYSEYRVNNKFEVKQPYILHASTLNDAKDGIISVFKAFAIIHKKFNYPVHFYLTNKIGLKKVIKVIEEIIKTNDLEKYVHFLNEPSDEILINYQKACSLTVINKINSEQNRFNFSTRLGEFLALGKPVITTRIGEVKNYLQNGVNCLFVEPNSSEEIAEKIIYLINNKDQADKIGRDGQEIAKKFFDYTLYSEKLKIFFNEINSKPFHMP